MTFFSRINYFYVLVKNIIMLSCYYYPIAKMSPKGKNATQPWKLFYTKKNSL